MAVEDSSAWLKLSSDIQESVDSALGWLRALPNDVVTARAYAENWSVKETIGHLINSATNNHHRFVWLQIKKEMALPVYSDENDAWVAVPNYQETGWEQLLDFFRAYHYHLAHIIRHVDVDCLENKWVVNENTSFTLGHLMTDYLNHLEGHLSEIKERVGKTKV